MAKYQVFEDGVPADSTARPGIRKNLGWDNSVFPTFVEAKAYAENWLGNWAAAIELIKVNAPIDYSGYGNMVEIRKTEE